MQKVIIVRTGIEGGREGAYSHEVDPLGSAPPHPLRRLLAAGWEIVHVCPMNSEIDSACLVVLDRPAAPPRPSGTRDLSLVEGDRPGPRLQTSPSRPIRQAADKWDGETIPLGIFRIDSAHQDEPSRPQ